MKKRMLVVLVIVSLFSFYSKVLASELCSPIGYSIYTVNGIFTDDRGAKENKKALEGRLTNTFNGQPLRVDYLYNPSHLAGVGDLIDAVQQGLFEQKSDYDLVEMLNDASQKVTTQKILLVAHSQGNFYANNFYDKTASQPGGVPGQSIGVYGVATPANRVAGEGKYLTSDTDGVIASTIARFVKILLPNVNIPLQSSDGNGHSFSDVYLKYQGDKIVSDIKSSLDQLKENDEQESGYPCIFPPELSAVHKIQGAILAVADPTAIVVKGGLVVTYNAGVYIADGAQSIGRTIGNSIHNTILATSSAFKGLLASAIGSSSDVNDVTTTPPDNISEPTGDNSSSSSNSNVTTTEIKSTSGETIVVDSAPNEREITTKNVLQPTVPKIVFRGGSSHASTPQLENSLLEEDAFPKEDVTPEEDPLPLEPPPPPVVPPVADIISPIIPDIVAPVITVLGNDPEAVLINSEYVDAGATALDAINGAVVVNTTGTVDTKTLGTYTITYNATDAAGNTATASRDVRVSSRVYIPKYKFGKENGDGHDWQVWSFNGSNIYDWSDTYVDNYLREQFKVQAYPGFWCSQCLQLGVFNHNPQNGFEPADLVYLAAINGNPQSEMNGVTYDVVLQWDSTGYTYTTSNGSSGSTIYATGHTEVPNMNNDSWVGWDGSFNNFERFLLDNWQGVVYASPLDRTGGSSMVLQPFPVYKNQSASVIPALSLSNKGPYAVGGINPTRGRTNLTPFSFQVIYTDGNNNAPQSVKLHVVNRATGISLPEIEMQKISPGADNLSDGNFANGESYGSSDILYDTGDYDYFFTANDSVGNLVRVPENGMLDFEVIPSTYTYIPKYTFGTGNGDGHDWQTWLFSGSNVYDWSDTYVNSYLKEQFKIQAYPRGSYCSSCVQRGIFNHDPQKGFEATDRTISGLENNPQNNGNDVTYNVTLQWDSSGYTYTIFDGSTIYATGHTNVSSVDENMWVGWDWAGNNFERFPLGSWSDEPIYNLPQGHTAGGYYMTLQPYRVYDPSQISSDPNPPTATPSSLKTITAFGFKNLTPEVVGVVDETGHAISLSVPFNTDVTNLTPTIIISDKATVVPNNNTAQNFTDPVSYVVTAEDGSTQNYTVTVTIAPEDTTVTQLKIITLPQTINVDTISNIITVQTQNAAKEDKKVIKTTHLILASSSVTGEFSSNNTNWNPVTTLTMNTGWANRNFYYKDSTSGTPTITISTDGLSFDSQTLIVLPLSPT